MNFVVAIDGPAASGKGTISKAVAQAFGFAHLDTGLLYRVVGRKALEDLGPAMEDEAAIIEIARTIAADDINRDDLRTAAVAQAASRVAVISGVRTALVDFQRSFAARDEGAVLDGRDIGTVICPDADVKLFVTASVAARAERRFKELADRGENTDYETVEADIAARDARDAEREEAPMRPAGDAVAIDTSDMSIEQAVAVATHEIKKKYEAAP